MKKDWKRLLSLLLAVCMIAGLLVVPAAAEDGDEEVGGDVTPAATVAAGTYNFVGSKNQETAPADFSADGLTWTGIAYGAGTEDHGPYSAIGGTLAVSTPADKYATLTLTLCRYGLGGTVSGADDIGVNAATDPVVTLYNVQGDVTITFSGEVYVHSLEVAYSDDTTTLYTVTVAEDIANGTVTVNPSGKVPAGTEITVTATPDDTYDLVADSLKYGDTAIEDGKFHVTGDATVTAQFAKKTTPEVKLDKTFVEVEKGGSATVNATVENLPNDASVTWSIASTGAASVCSPSVDENGVVTVSGDDNGEGIDIIVKATVNGEDYTATFKVTVWTAPATSWNFKSDAFAAAMEGNATNEVTWRGLTVGASNKSANASYGLCGYGGPDITVPVGVGENTITVAASYAGGSVALGDDAETIDAVGDLTFTYTATEAGTVTLNTGANTYIGSISVTTVAVTTPTVDKTALNTAIADANAAKAGVEVNTDAADVAEGTQWVTQEEMDALNAAIGTAQGVADTATTQDEVDAAVTTLNAAVGAFNSAKQNGAKVELKTIVYTAPDVNVKFDGQPHSLVVKVTDPAEGATVTYKTTADGEYTANNTTFHAPGGAQTVYFKITAEGYTPVEDSATVTITKADKPAIKLEADITSVSSTGGVVTFTVTGVPRSSSVVPTVNCDQDGAIPLTWVSNQDHTSTFTGTKTIGEATEAKTHTVTLTWADDNFEAIDPVTCTIDQLEPGAVAPVAATNLKVSDIVDYAALGVTATAGNNKVTYTIDEAALQTAWADADKKAIITGNSMNHDGVAYLCFTFEAPEGVDNTWKVSQKVNGDLEETKHALNGTDAFDVWTVDGKMVIGDWFGIASIADDTLTICDAKSWNGVEYHFYEDGADKAAAIVTLNVERKVTAAPATADKDELNDAIAAAEAAIEAVKVSEDGSDVATTAKWVTEDDKADYQDAIDAAKAVAENDEATQTEVGEAVAALADATTAFEAAQKAGTKTVTPEKVDKDALKAAIDAAKDLVKNTTFTTQEDNLAGEKYWDNDMKAAYEAAIATAQAVVDDAAATAADVNAAQAVLATATTDFKAGKTDGTKVLEGDELTAALADAITAATTAKKDVEANDATDPSMVTKGTKYVPTAVMTALENALKAAQDKKALLDDEDAENDPTAEELTAALVALKNAMTDFKPETGAKSSGGGRPSYTSSGTVSNTDKNSETLADGTKRETVTDKDGTVTVTETKTDGTKTVTTTTPGGEVTTAVTLGKGVGSAKVSVPVDKANSGMVALVVKADGAEEIIRDTAVVDGNVIFKLDKDATVKIVNNAKTFVDIRGHWGQAYVNFVSARELFNGVDASHFAPDAAMTRGMMATVLFRLDGETKTRTNVTFSDVKPGEWYSDAVDWASRAGIVNGYTDGTFLPTKSINREELAVMIYRYAKAAGLVTEGSDTLIYDDAEQVSDWAKEAVSWLTANGILNGRLGNRFDPKGNATRAEVSAVLERYVTLVNKK